MMNQLKRKTRKSYNCQQHAHELTFSCYKNQQFLAKIRTKQYLIDAINNAGNKYNFDVWAYVIMPNHVHLLIWPKNDNYSVSKILLSIKQSVSRRAIIFLRKQNPDGLKFLDTGQKDTPYRFWQAGGGYDRNVINRESLIKMVDYIHCNPFSLIYS